MIPDSHRQARNLTMTQECLVSDLFHKHGLTEGPNKEHPHKHAGEHAHSNHAYAIEVKRVTCWTKGYHESLVDTPAERSEQGVGKPWEDLQGTWQSPA